VNFIAKYIVIGLISIVLHSCGTHGHIESFYLDYTKEEITSIVDDFLLNNPTYYEVENDFYPNWIHIKIPKTGERFVFRIGQIEEKAEIDLILACPANDFPKKYFELKESQKRKLKESFKINFIDKLKDIKPHQIKLVMSPFILSFNVGIDTICWPDYFIKKDTLISYPLPEEIDSTRIDYFEDLVKLFSIDEKIKIEINQCCNVFRINNEYSGYINDSIHVIAFYRRVGENKKHLIFFNDTRWLKYTDKNNQQKREITYKNLRSKNTKENRYETEVYLKTSEEFWMLNDSKLDTSKMISN
jgi:hypothetical protein